MATDDQTESTGYAPSHNRRGLDRFSGTLVFPETGNKALHWEVNDFRLNVSPPELLPRLSAQERAKLFNNVIAHVIKRSEHPDGSHGAVVAITENGDILVANNNQRQHEFHKDCAEINLINVLTQLLGSKVRISDMYLSIGKEDQLLCPCGKCMDTLSKASKPDAKITMFPVNNGSLPIELNTSANSLSELIPGQSWQTTISHFMPYTTLPLSTKARAFGEEGWKQLTGGNPLVTQPLGHDEIKRIQRTKSRKLSPGDQHIRKIMDRAATNAAMRSINGEPELDVNHSPEAINNFLVERITRAYHACQPAKIPGQREAEMVRCAVVRLADGSFHSATEIEGINENAVPYAEVTAVAATRTVAQPITDLWVMQLNREDIAQGIMRTSPKEALERVYKRRPASEEHVADNEGKSIKDSVNVHYIPFNTGKLTRDEVGDISQEFTIDKLYISQWKGSRHYWLRNGNDNSKAALPGRH